MFAATALVFAVGLSTPALERGDTCVLKSPLSVSIRQKSGTLESTLERGTSVEVVGVSDGGSARIRAGDLKGDVSAADLEGACSGTLRLCRLTSEVMMYEQNRSDSKSWRLKVDATVSILKKGKTWAAVRVNDLRGFVKSDDIQGACTTDPSAVAPTDVGARGSDEVDANVDAVERGDGPGVLLVPFSLEGAAPAGSADTLLGSLYDRTAFFRPDAARLPLEDSTARSLEWRALVQAAAKRAKGADTAYVIVGRLGLEAAKAGAPERYLLQLGVVDAKKGIVLKAIKIRPTLDVRDNWADKALSALLPLVAAAPNSKMPVVEGGFEIARVNDGANADGANANANNVNTQKLPPPEDNGPTPTLANPWGWAALGGAAALGAGSGIVAVLALDENDRANEISAADPAHAERRNTALAEAITADALAVAAVGVGVAGIVVFATRAGLE